MVCLHGGKLSPAGVLPSFESPLKRVNLHQHHPTPQVLLPELA